MEIISILKNIIVETARECGEDGMPSGPAYVALQSKVPALDLELWNLLTSRLISEGRITVRNYVIYAK